MGIFDNLLSKLGYIPVRATDMQTPQFMRDMAGMAKSSIPDGSMYHHQSELYQRLSWVNGAVGITARTAASVQINVKRAAGEDMTDIPNHAFEKLLAHPNPAQSRFEFLEATYSYLALTGNAYWWLNRTRANQEPAELWCVPTWRMAPVPNEKMYLAGYTYDPGDGELETLDTWEVVHFKSFNPTNEFVGLSPIEALATISIGDLKMQDWNTRLFADNNARLPGILAFSDAIGDPQWELIKADVNDAANKRRQMMLRGAGKGGVEWIQAALSQRDMEFLQGRQMNKEEIFGIFAPGLASMLAINATEANAKTGKATFLEFAIHPMLQRVSEKISNDLMPVYGPDYAATFEDVRQTDRALKLAEQAEYAKTHTLNEVRKEFYGDDPLPDERGDLLPAQIGPGTTATPAPEPVTITETPAPVFDVAEPEPPDDLEQDDATQELKSWRRAAVRAMKQNKPLPVDWRPVAISQTDADRIKAALAHATTPASLAAIFGRQDKPDLAAELRRANDMLERVTA